MDNLYAIIMAGGNGERFWPLSTPERPKQFLDIFGGKTLLRHAVDRLEGLVPPERIFVVTAQRFAEMTRAELPMLPVENLVCEPCRRNTAAAAAVACALALRRGGPNAVGCILTADHLISPPDVFRQTLADAAELAARTDSVITMGIVPTRPETGYGYIELGERDGEGSIFHRALGFVEKPCAEVAARYVESGRYLWNSGMFIWRASFLRAAYSEHAPDFLPLIDGVVSTADVASYINSIYPSLRSTSIDYAVMEKLHDIIVAESRFDWDDVGAWTSIGAHFPKDPSGNTLLGNVVLRDTSDSVVVSEDGHLTVVMGLEDAVVVHTPAATLVCAKSQLHRLREICSLDQSGRN